MSSRDLVHLDPHQERAVTVSGHCTILACPGSGKTRVLSARAAYLLTNNQIGRLCAVTFTREAANELRSRILQASGDAHAKRLAGGTFHSLALAQIKRYSKGKAPRLLTDGERLAVLRRSWKQHAPDLPFDSVVQNVDRVKARLAPPIFSDSDMEFVYHGYQELMASEGVLDFSDLLLTTVRSMASGDMPPLPIRWLLVDEAQDMDEVQMEWILLHGRAGVEVTLVGDDDQSLYAFRQALGYDGLQEITYALSATQTTLPNNYRCAPNILEHAANLIAYNKNRAPKKITANKETLGKITVLRLPDRWAEVYQIGTTIKNDSDSQEWGILARTNNILDTVELALSNMAIPYSRVGGKSIWDHSIGSVFTGLLRSTIDDSWTGIANALEFCGVNAEWINRFSLATKGNCRDRLYMALELAKDNGIKKTVAQMYSGLASWSDQASIGRPALVIHGIAGFLADYCKPNHLTLLRRLEESLAKMQGTLAQRLSILGRNNQTRQQPSIQIMTLHASKGLEFENVWIMGCEDGNIPHVDSPDEEEERRLLYVGMTRARSNLILSSAIEEGYKSRFLEEAKLA